jgi:hypothetical protein
MVDHSNIPINNVLHIPILLSKTKNSNSNGPMSEYNNGLKVLLVQQLLIDMPLFQPTLVYQFRYYNGQHPELQRLRKSPLYQHNAEDLGMTNARLLTLLKSLRNNGGRLHHLQLFPYKQRRGRRLEIAFPIREWR